MKRTKKASKGRFKAGRSIKSLLKNSAFGPVLAFLVLPMMLLSAHFIAGSVSAAKGSRQAKSVMEASQAKGGGSAAIGPAYGRGFSPREIYELLNYACGTCDKPLTHCFCPIAKGMRNEVLSAKEEHKTKNEILGLMVARYGKKVLSNRAALSRRQPPPGTPRPSIQVEPLSYDFGTIHQEVVSHVFIVKNRGNAELIIDRITTSCGCTTARIDKHRISPGGKATLTVTFDPLVHKTKRKARRTVFLKTNDPVSPVKEIRLTAFVKAKDEATGNLPAFAFNSSRALRAYRIATKIPQVLEVMPCYCGCGRQSGHHHLKDCFIKADGSYDDHGAGCNLCDREAIDVKKWLDQNMSVKQIRARIHEKYKEFGSPTKTPPI